MELAQDLRWGPPLNKVIPKAQRTLNLLRRNLYNCSGETKDMAYRTMVRPVLEYAACAWDPYNAEQIQRMEAVQKRQLAWSRVSTIGTLLRWKAENEDA